MAPTTHIITLASDDKKDEVMKHVKEQGGSVTDEHNILGGILSVNFPQDKVNTLGSHPGIKDVEAADKSVHTQ